jgi:hypothetical protein
LEKLLPCPFCGAEAKCERIGTHRFSTIVQCTECGCSLENGEEWGHGRGWNTRASLPAVGVVTRSDGAKFNPTCSCAMCRSYFNSTPSP